MGDWYTQTGTADSTSSSGTGAWTAENMHWLDRVATEVCKWVRLLLLPPKYRASTHSSSSLGWVLFCLTLPARRCGPQRRVFVKRGMHACFLPACVHATCVHGDPETCMHTACMYKRSRKIQLLNPAALGVFFVHPLLYTIGVAREGVSKPTTAPLEIGGWQFKLPVLL